MALCCAAIKHRWITNSSGPIRYFPSRRGTPLTSSCLPVMPAPTTTMSAMPTCPFQRQRVQGITAYYTPIGNIRCRLLHAKPNQVNFGKSSEKNATDSGGMVLYDSLSMSYRPLLENDNFDVDEMQPQGLAWYTCGPTVYDAAHLGHARTYVTMDIVRRILVHRHATSAFNRSKTLSLPPPPMFLMNITDVDDKILQRASQLQIPPLELARKYEAEFFRDLRDLNVLRPDVVARVSEHVEDAIVPYVQKILDHGLAYVMWDEDQDQDEEAQPSVVADDLAEASRLEKRGSVYFDVTAFERQQGRRNKYGKLAPSTAAVESTDFFAWQNSQEATQQDPNQSGKNKKKRDSRDFVLWKARKEGEDLFWESPWGQGRPGWHVECSAMIDAIMDKLGETHKLQVHAGGIDLKFPHHTNEIAQAEAYRATATMSKNENEDEEWIPHWVHTGHLHIQGAKMSKSLKNFITIRDMLEPPGFTNTAPPSLSWSPADDFRLWCLCLSGSYRGPATYSKARLEEARVLREKKLVKFLECGSDWLSRCQQDLGVSSSSSSLLATTDTTGDENTSPKSRKWTEQDYNLVRLAHSFETSCFAALTGRVGSQGKGGLELDGKAWLDACIQLAEAGMQYMKNANKNGCFSQEPMQRTLSIFRGQLSLVGFSNKTVKAGMRMEDFENNEKACDSRGMVHTTRIKGGEEALVQEYLTFRSKVRSMALEGVRGGKHEEGADTSTKTQLLEVLKLCDLVRDETLPSLGVEVQDRHDMANNNDSCEHNALFQWNWCMPRSPSQNHNSRKPSSDDDANQMPDPNDFFRVGTYQGQFSKFDADGIPTEYASDGKPVTKTMRKKLRKKLDKYANKVKKETNTK